MKYCKKCLFPDTKPQLKFAQNGICDACNYSKIKTNVDWEAKKAELKQIVEKYRSKDGSNYDCIVPVSGGKDSTFQAWYMKTEFGLNPLLVNFHPRDQTPLGRKNLENLKNLGFDCVEYSVNPNVYKKLAKFGLEELGDVAWPEHMGIFTSPLLAALHYKVPLAVMGENTALEYGGPQEIALNPVFDIKYDEKHGSFFQDKVKAEDMVKYGFKLSELKHLMYPPEEELKKVGVVMIFLGNFVKWDAISQLETVKKLGFSVLDKPNYGTYTNYENLDTKTVQMHDYFKWLKYGFGRATDHTSIDIRNDRLTREEGLKLVKKYEGKIPTEYLDEILNDLNLTYDDFLRICDKFTNKELFKTDKNGQLIRDEADNIEKIYYDNP
jgi:N-acetyl sugar amidotransferase